MAFDATPGSATATSYCDVAFADAYWAGRLNGASWAAITDAAKKQAALQQATLALDSKQWTGRPASATQALAWPRTGARTRDNILIPYTDIPTKLKQATAELAGQLVTEDRSVDGGMTNLKKLKIGPLDLEFNTENPLNELTPLVETLIQPLLGSGFSPTVRT